MSAPKISVVMPAYNAEKYIAEAIDSILEQTFKDFEFIIINDGSTDKTEEIILSYKDSRIVYIKNEKNMGIVYTLNRGLEAAQGEYIARMDSDDISLPTRFEEQVKYLENNSNIAVLGTAVIVFGEGILTDIHKFSYIPTKIKAELLFSCSLAHPTIMMRSAILKKYHLQYEEEYDGMEDFVFWWRIAQFEDISSLTIPLLKYRRHQAQITAVKNSQKIEKARRFLLERIQIFGIPFSKEELNSIQKYCIYSCKGITYTDIQNLIILYKRFLNINKKIKCFSQKDLREELCSSIIRYINSVQNLKNIKVRSYIFALKNKVLPMAVFLKLSVKKFFI